jgi:two-component system, NtrC family, sensor kinase
MIINKNPYSKLKRIIFFIMILVPAIPFISVLGIGYYYFTTSIENGTLAAMTRLVEDHSRMIETYLIERKGDLEFILDTSSLRDLTDKKKFRALFTQLEQKSRAFLDFSLFNDEGFQVMVQGPFKIRGRNYAREDWFKQVMKKKFYISDVFLGFRRVPHFIIAVAREESGKQWVLRATIDADVFNQIVESVRIGKTGEIYILNTHELLQTKRRSGGNLLDPDSDGIAEAKPHTGVRTFVKKNPKGVEYLYATSWLNNRQWLLVVRQETADAFRSLRSATFFIFFIILLGGLTIMALAYFLTEAIIRRMQRLDTEKMSLSQQLVRASRLAEIGQMAAGFAHEINNPLQIMKSEQTLIETLFSEMKKKEDLKESADLLEIEDSVHQIRVQILRCAEITQAVLKFGRQTEPVIRAVNLAAFIPEVTRMVAKRASVQGVAIKEEIADNTPLVQVDASQLEQVLLNLLNNAIDAIMAKYGSKGGILAVAVGPEEHGKVKITVRDNGVGISPENMKNIFTPFFTTKPVGQGTGLGLSVCYGILNGMGGTVEVKSEERRGTTFSVHLPAIR